MHSKAGRGLPPGCKQSGAARSLRRALRALWAFFLGFLEFQLRVSTAFWTAGVGVWALVTSWVKPSFVSSRKGLNANLLTDSAGPAGGAQGGEAFSMKSALRPPPLAPATAGPLPQKKQNN